MNILVLGSGGREHALCWKIAKSPLKSSLFCAPGNGGTATVATNVSLDIDDPSTVLEFVREKEIELVVIGPEAPLVAGVADVLREAGVLAFGPGSSGARLEGSKAFAKEFLERHNIPTAGFRVVHSFEEGMAYLGEHGAPIVVKADGLASGKGVVVAFEEEEAEAALRRMFIDREFGDAANLVVMEDLIPGEEASVLAFTDGETILPLPAAQDHKRAGDGDIGPNTGGMGAYSPTPAVSPALAEVIRATILEPAIRGLKADGIPFRGILYAGLMIMGGQPFVLEFNVRFGDPECQPLMARVQSDLVPVLVACAKGDLAGTELTIDPRPALCVVAVAAGYPGSYIKGHTITGLNRASHQSGVVVFHGGTAIKTGQVVTNGGRVLGVTALGDTVIQARDRAYAALGEINFEGITYRKDIAARAVGRM